MPARTHSKRAHAVFLTALVLCPLPSLGAGFEYPDNGARALSRGGAFVASGDDPTLIAHNPAGLAGLGGWRLSLDGQLVWWATEYQRLARDTEGEWSNLDPSSGEMMRPVSNSRNPWITPFLAMSREVREGLTLAIGAYGPSAIGERRYPDPREIAPYFWDGEYEPGEENSHVVQEYIPRLAPQRYMMIRLLNLIVFPTLSVGWEPVSWLRVGCSGQLIWAATKYSLALRSDAAALMLGDGPQSDIIGELDVRTRRLGLTGIMGLQVRPIDSVTLGVTYRPGFTLRQEGTFRLHFNDYQADETHGAGLRQVRDEAVFTTRMPSMYRLGVAWRDSGWLVEIAGSYERLSVVDAYVLEPNIRLEHRLPLDPIEIAGERIVLEKDWRDAWGLRIGAGADLRQALGMSPPLEVFAGLSFEQGAIPPETQNLDFISTSRSQASLGLAYDLGRARFTTTVSRTFEPLVEVRDSRVFMIDDAALDPRPDLPPEEQLERLTMVGYGDYRSSHTMLMISVEGRFGAH